MKVLVLGAGAGWSTKDVENGVVDGLRSSGVEVGRYAYEHRLGTSDDYLRWVYRRAKKQQPSTPKPSAVDVQLHALVDVLPRALAHRVDFVVVVSGMFVPFSFLEVLHEAVPVGLVLTESPYQMADEMKWASRADVVWTNERSVLEQFSAVQPCSHYLPHAWRPSVHSPQRPVTAETPAHDVVFVGTGFDERIALLEAIDWTGVDLGLYGNWGRLSRRSPLRPFVRGGIVDNVVAAELYRQAKIGLNLYRSQAGWRGDGPPITAESLNPRAYELAACGCFSLSSYRAEVVARFGALVPTFTTPDECEQLIRTWLVDAEGRQAASAALPDRVADATWTHNGRAMRQHLEAALPEALARRIATLERKLAHQRVAA